MTYDFEPYTGKKQRCPQCDKNSLVRFIEPDTGNIIADNVGKCDHRIHCGYIYTPEQYFKDKGIKKDVVCSFVPADNITDYSDKALSFYQNKVKKFVPKAVVYKRTQSGIYVADYFLKDNSKVIFNEQDKKSFADNGTVKRIKVKPKEKPVFAHSKETDSNIKTDTVCLTEINGAANGNNPKGVLGYYSMDGLNLKLNQYKKGTDKKSDAPDFLTGIFENGTKTEHCTKAAPFLPFDIDVGNKDDKRINLILFDNDLNQKVFEFMQKVSVLVFRSDSGKGIAGFIYVPELAGFTDSEKHLKRAKAVYQYLSLLVCRNTGVYVQFDNSQGALRHIRRIAEQSAKRTLNLKPLEFYTNNTPIKKQLITGALFSVFKSSLQPDNNLSEIAENNTFIKYLIKIVGTQKTNDIVSKYYIGTSEKTKGAVIFWQLDRDKNIRAGKIMLYKADTGKRIRDKNGLTWIHKELKQPFFKGIQCLFGEHLIKGNDKPIAIVESEKTALICSVYLPKFIWLATGTIEGLTYERLKPLQGRKIILYPDTKAFELWSKKAKELKQFDIKISTYLEQIANDTAKEKEFDLADYLPEKKRLNEPERILQQYEAGNLSDNEYLDKMQKNFEGSGLSGQDYVNEVNGYDWQTELKNIIHDYKSGAINEPTFYERIVKNADKSGISDAEFEKVLNSYYL